MQQTRKPFVIGFLGTMSIVSAFIILLYATTFKEATDILLSAMVMLLAGLFMASVTVGLKWQPFSLKQFFETFMWTALNFGAILILNRYIPFRLDVTTTLPERYFAVLMGVVEECFFRVFLCGFVYRMFNSGLLAIGTSSKVWSVYHIARYGGNFNILLIIFMCGCVLGASFIYSRNADGCILAHGVVNWIAVP